MNLTSRLGLFLLISCLWAMTVEAQSQNESNDKSNNESTTNSPTSNEARQYNLFDGQSLTGWKITEFGGEGECSVEDGVMVVEMGYPMSGVTYEGKELPKTNYEISLEARRTQGEDFFCGLTFPVENSFCTFIAGGWGGTVTGLSCIDDADASNNDTRKVINYNINQWYKIKIRVEPGAIQVWLDDKRIVNQDLKNHKVSLRNETKPSRPLGICNYQTYSEYKNIRLTKLSTPKSNSSKSGN